MFLLSCVPAVVQTVNKGPVSVFPWRGPRPLPPHTLFAGDKRLCWTLRLGITHSLALSHPFFFLTEHGNLFHPTISLSLHPSQRGTLILSFSSFFIFSIPDISFSLCSSANLLLHLSVGPEAPNRIISWGLWGLASALEILIHTYCTSSALSSTALRVELPLRLTYSAQCIEKLRNKRWSHKRCEREREMKGWLWGTQIVCVVFTNPQKPFSYRGTKTCINFAQWIKRERYNLSERYWSNN